VSPQIRLSAPHLTAQFVLTDMEAYLAYAWKRDPLGPNGESYVAVILHTQDSGATWRELTWRRTWWSRVRHAGYPVWPPEAVLSLEQTTHGLTITHRDEWVPFEPGGESLWRSHFGRGRWHCARVRLMDYEGADNAANVPALVAELPPTMQSPRIPRDTIEREWGHHRFPPERASMLSDAPRGGQHE
jgi:hypothetical protein